MQNPLNAQYTMVEANEIRLRRKQHDLDIYQLECSIGEIVMESIATDFGFLPYKCPDSGAPTAWWKTVAFDPIEILNMGKQISYDYRN